MKELRCKKQMKRKKVNVLMYFSIVFTSQYHTHSLAMASPLAQFLGASEMENKTTATKCVQGVERKSFQGQSICCHQKDYDYLYFEICDGNQREKNMA